MAQRFKYILTGAAALLVFAEPAYANSSLGIAWGGYPTITIGLATLGIGSIIVFLIEAYIIKRVTDLTWRRAIVVSLVINIASTFVGYLVMLCVGLPYSRGLIDMLMLVSLLFIFYFLRKGRLKILALIVPASIIAGSYEIGLMDMYLDPSVPSSMIMGCIYLQILLGFGLSIAIEYPVGEWVMNKDRARKSVLLANLASYVFICITAPFFWPNPVTQAFNIRHPMWERRAGPDKVVSPGYLGGKTSSEIGMNLEKYVRKELSTPQLLGIFSVKYPIRPGNEDEYVRGVVYTALRNMEGLSPAIERVTNAPEMETYLEILNSKFVFSDDAKRKYEWALLSLELWPEILELIDARDLDRFMATYDRWIDEEDKLGVDELKYIGYSRNHKISPGHYLLFKGDSKVRTLDYYLDSYIRDELLEKEEIIEILTENPGSVAEVMEAVFEKMELTESLEAEQQE